MTVKNGKENSLSHSYEQIASWVERRSRKRGKNRVDRKILTFLGH